LVAAVERLVSGDKSKALVLYCNGPFCQASRRLGEQLVAAGFTNVRRYQLGIPIWRALGGPTEIAVEGIVRIFNGDRTAVFFDARSPQEFAKGSLPGAHNVPADQIASGVLDRAPLPLDDFNTRIVLFGRDGAQARALADALSKKPWHNVTYFPGTFESLRAAIK
jgi:rhodanese-related sulfurtransferase